MNVVSFGFKYGIPLEADLVFDVRFLPNPFYVPELKHKTGMDSEVYDYVFSFPQTKTFIDKLEGMLSFLLPLYAEEGKSSSSPSAARAGTTAACPSRAAWRPTSRPWAIPRLKITATSRAAEASF